MRNYTHGHGGRATLWRDAMFAVLRADGCAKMALRYGSQSKEVKRTKQSQHYALCVAYRQDSPYLTSLVSDRSSWVLPAVVNVLRSVVAGGTPVEAAHWLTLRAIDWLAGERCVVDATSLSQFPNCYHGLSPPLLPYGS